MCLRSINGLLMAPPGKERISRPVSGLARTWGGRHCTAESKGDERRHRIDEGGRKRVSFAADALSIKTERNEDLPWGLGLDGRYRDPDPYSLIPAISISSAQRSGLPRSLKRLRRHILRPGPQPPDHTAAYHQPDCDQLRPRHRPAKHRPAPRIVPQIFQKKSRHTIDEQERAKHLAIEFSVLQKPHQEEEVRQLDRRLEQLRV